MCEVCRQSPCASGCPNAPEQKTIEICSECGEGIYEGDSFFDGPDGPICNECMEEKSPNEILEMLGEKMTTAEVA